MVFPLKMSIFHRFPSFFGCLPMFTIDIHRQRRHVGGLRLFGVFGDLGLRAGGQDARPRAAACETGKTLLQNGENGGFSAGKW